MPLYGIICIQALQLSQLYCTLVLARTVGTSTPSDIAHPLHLKMAVVRNAVGGKYRPASDSQLRQIMYAHRVSKIVGHTMLYSGWISRDEIVVCNSRQQPLLHCRDRNAYTIGTWPLR